MMQKILETSYNPPWRDSGILVTKSTWYYDNGIIYRDIGSGPVRNFTAKEVLNTFANFLPQGGEMREVLQFLRNREINYG